VALRLAVAHHLALAGDACRGSAENALSSTDQKKEDAMSTATAKPKKPKAPGRPPELKIGPFQGGIGVAVWLNEVQTESGPRTIRSISIAPRRYKDKQTGEWKDSGSFRPGDLTALILALFVA